MKKFFKKFGFYAVNILALLGMTPWFLMTLIGYVTGGFATAFMNGLRKGSVKVNNVSLSMAYLRAKAKISKNARYTLAIIQDKYPDGVDKLYTEYSIRKGKHRTEFIFSIFGADFTSQVEYYLKNQYGK